MSGDLLEISRPLVRVTLALGLFDRAVALLSAVRDLAAQKLSLDGLQVITNDASIKPERIAAELPGGTTGAMGSCVHRFESEQASDVLQGLYSLACPDPSRSYSGSPSGRALSSWLNERQARSLERHLRAGGTILMIPLQNAYEQRVICSILLHYADAGVQTHQLRCSSTSIIPGTGSLTPDVA